MLQKIHDKNLTNIISQMLHHLQAIPIYVNINIFYKNPQIPKTFF